MDKLAMGMIAIPETQYDKLVASTAWCPCGDAMEALENVYPEVYYCLGCDKYYKLHEVQAPKTTTASKERTIKPTVARQFKKKTYKKK